MGGGARGLAHLGVLEALAAAGLTPDAIAGTSMGALIGGFRAAGVPLEEIRDLAAELGSPRRSEKPRLGRRSRNMTALFQQVMIGTSRDRILKKIGFERGDRVESLLKEIVGDRRIEDLDMPFACNAVDVLSGREVVFTGGLLRRALRASMAYPLVFEPVRWDKMLLIDGGLVHSAPIDLVRALNVPIVIAPDIRRPIGRFPASGAAHAFKYFPRISQIVFAHQAEVQLQAADLRYPIGLDVEMFDFSDPESIIAQGRKATEDNLEDIRALVEP